jgi:hypothetical protein
MTAGSKVAAVAFALHNPGAMLRRAILFAILLAPVAGRAQTMSSSDPGPFTELECSSTHPSMQLTWSMAAGVALPLNGTYRVLASKTNDCTFVASPSNVVKSGLLATALTNVKYPADGITTDTLDLGDLVAASGVTCTASPAIYVCAQLLQQNGDLVASTNTLTLSVEAGPPPPPASVLVDAGENALKVSWVDGVVSGNTIVAAQFRVEAVAVSCPTKPTFCVSPVVHKRTVNVTSARVEGLENDVTYAVTVIAISATGNESAASSPAVDGTPIEVIDFWEKYTDMNGPDVGGCAGGPAGLLSFLAVAGLVRALRRRS